MTKVNFVRFVYNGGPYHQPDPSGSCRCIYLHPVGVERPASDVAQAIAGIGAGVWTSGVTSLPRPRGDIPDTAHDQD